MRFQQYASVALALAIALPAQAATLTTLASFNGTNGDSPRGTLLADAAGNLFGTTLVGSGSAANGTVFRLDAGASTITTLASFGGQNRNPIGGLITDAAGNLFGVTDRGGINDNGSVFRLNAGTNSITTLARFNGTNGRGPRGALFADTAGNLFGTANGGGASGLGTVFKIAAGTNALTTLVSFSGANGRSPTGGLLGDGMGNLFGATQSGGAFGFGTVFRIDAGTNALTTLVNFNDANGRGPGGGLMADAAGNLFGTTNGGGASARGTVFRIDAGTNALTTLASFDGANGQNPFAGLLTDGVGNLFGTTTSGGTSDRGTVFRLDANTNTLTTLISFNGANGQDPMAGLVADGAGNLFGTTTRGGASGRGTVFRVSDAGFTQAPAPGAVPEPATWAMMIVGFGAVGGAMRRKKQITTNAEFA